MTPKQKLEGAHYIAFTARTLVTPLLWQPTSWQSVFHKHIETRCRDCTCHQSHLCTGLWRCGTIQTHPINSSHNQPLNTCGEVTSQNVWSLNNRRFVWSWGGENLSCYSVLWRCWLGGRKGIRPVKNWVVRCWCGYLSGARCRLEHAQLMPLPFTISCSSKIQIGFTFLVPAHPGSPGQRAVKRVCVCYSNKNRIGLRKCPLR